MRASDATRRSLGNLAAFGIGSLLVLALLEGVIFRFLLPGSDVPVNDFQNGVVRYRPHQTGVYRVRNEITAPFRINANGWNAARDEFVESRVAGKRRIAIVGDSYVEALQVPFDGSLAEHLERKLGPARTEVYRFGMSGAPLSQYLHMLEREVLQFRPDVVVIVLVHNDIAESYRFVPGRYTSSFLKLRVADGRVEAEIPPTPYEPGGWEWLRRSATSRFLYYRWGGRAWTLPFRARDEGEQAPRFEANVDVAHLQSELADLRLVTAHLLSRLSAIAASAGTRLVPVMDGVRSVIYRPDASSGPLAPSALDLNTLVAEESARLGIEFLDLHEVFGSAHAASGERFEFVSDNHWNERGHEVVAAAIAEYLTRSVTAN